MPRAPAFKIDALADLLRQLEYAPPETRKRQMDAAERLVADIDPAVAYPRSFVIYRITGFRPEGDDGLLTFTGAALRADLLNLVQRLSDGLNLPASRDGHSALTLEQAQSRLGVSAKTLQRYRREALVCHFVDDGADGKRLSCYVDALERFASSRPDRMRRASLFTRMGEATEQRIIEEARELRTAEGLTLNAAAAALAARYGRAHETMRQLLRKHERRSNETIFTERGPLSEGEERIIHRAWLRGIDLGPLAQRFGRSRAAMHRAVTAQRKALLTSLRLSHIELPTFSLHDAHSVVLSSPHVTRDLMALPPHDDALRLVEWASSAMPMPESMEDSLLAGWNLLKKRAAEGISLLRADPTPPSERVDTIETDLRWATLLHRRLALAAFPAALRRIEFNLGRSLLTQPTEQITALILVAAGVIREMLETIDPSRGQHLDRVIGFAVERELAARGGLGQSATRASARHAGPLRLAGAFDSLDEWERRLDPWRCAAADTWSAAMMPLGGQVEAPESRQLLAWRYGWDGGPPHTIRAIARRVGIAPAAAARRIQKAIRDLRTSIRAQQQ